ncbi:MAG: MoxR-like ATPase [Gammaproteobacteria bacterium]|jgi:MoxR-like ATPase|nr:MoxR-like ATPase [Gammaproteobacteria bacterium]
MNQKPAAIQESRPMPVESDAAMRAARETVLENSTWIGPLQTEMARVIVGQKHLLDRLLVALLTNGHVLLEGVPGLAKTLALKTLASGIAVRFKRLQFTPDMLPADIVGTMIYNPQDGAFRTKHGPIFSNLVLADEINRAPAKVQSALLEAMQERQVTIGDETYPLPNPFLVLATQNPLEQEGTYPLPEAQIDRFMMKVVVSYPNRAEERAILDAMATSEALPSARPVVSAQQILDARHVVNSLYIDDKVRNYIVDLVLATRPPIAKNLEGYIQTGASPRATINLTLAARAIAFLNGRHYVTPQDVKSIALDVLRHRVSVTYEAEAENVTSEDVIHKILDALPVP